MKKEQIYDLLSAYGYQKQLDDPEHCRTRFKGEFGFLDLWIGHKRTTVGIYNPVSKVMHYKRVRTMEQLEDWLQAD